MTLTYPLPLADFWLRLPIRRIKFAPPGMTTHARTRGGEILPAAIGDRLWQADVEMDLMTADEWRAIRPLLHVLDDAGPSFLMTDPLHPAPAADPTGAGLTGAQPKIDRVGADGQLHLTGLPARYQLSAGDMIGWRYGTNPVRQALHEIVLDAPATVAGLASLTLTPPPQPGWSAGADVVLIRPRCKAVLLPDSLDEGFGRAGGDREGVRFVACQTLR